MPTKLKPYMVRFLPDLQAKIEKEAAFNVRPVANQIVFILEKYFEEKAKEMEYFRPAQLREARGQEEPQFFQTPVPPLAVPLRNSQKKASQDRT